MSTSVRSKPACAASLASNAPRERAESRGLELSILAHEVHTVGSALAELAARWKLRISDFQSADFSTPMAGESMVAVQATLHVSENDCDDLPDLPDCPDLPDLFGEIDELADAHGWAVAFSPSRCLSTRHACA